MTELESALVEVSAFLTQLHAPHMLIGGLAVAMWGEPRGTLDVDISVWVAPGDLENSVAAIAQRFTTVSDPVKFVAETRVLPIMANSVRVDLVFAAIDYERSMLDRTSTKQINGALVPVISVEDLIFMKLVSERPKDRDDASKLLWRFRRTLDREYLEPRLREISEALDAPDILTTFLSHLA